jgi:2-aminoadipate transaminase
MPLNFANRLSNVETSAIRELFKLQGKPGIISFAGGFPDASLFDVEGLQRATEVVLEKEAFTALQYGATEGYPSLREQLSFLMAKRGAVVNSDQILVTTGSQQALDLIGKTMINQGDKVIVEAPTFLATIQAFRLYGAELIGAPIDEDGVIPDDLEKLIVEHRPKMIYLVPTFSNPSGVTLSLERRLRILAMATKYKVLVVEDDPYGELYFNHPPPASLLALSTKVPGSRDFLAHCGSLSKVLSPGLRVGWLIGPPSLLANASMCKQFSDAHTSTFAQAVAARYLQSDRMDRVLSKIRATYSERSQTMCNGLAQLFGQQVGFNRPQGGMFIWAKLLSGDTDATALSKRAVENGVAFVPGTPFYASHPDSATFRMSFATSDVGRIRDGIDRLSKAL